MCQVTRLACEANGINQEADADCIVTLTMQCQRSVWSRNITIM